MMRGTPLNTQMQKAVISAYQFFEKEKNNGCVISVSRPIERTASALGLSRSTVCHYLGKWRRGEELITPGKRRPRSKPKREVDDITKGAIRNIIYDLHLKGVNITVTTLLAELRKSEVSFTGARETLRRVLHDLGFKFSKTDGRRYILQEATNETKQKSKKSTHSAPPQAPPPQPLPPPQQPPPPQQQQQQQPPLPQPIQMQQQLPQMSQTQHLAVSQAPPVTHQQHLSAVSHVQHMHHQQQPPHVQVPQVQQVQHSQHLQQPPHMQQQSHLHMQHVQQLPHPADTRPRPCLPRDDVVNALHSIAGLMQRADGSYVDTSQRH